MFPTICTIGPFTVYSYGLMLAVAVVVCSYLLSKDARRTGIDPEMIYDLVFWLVIGGIAGARMFYVLLNLNHFLNDPVGILKIWEGGLSWQGGLIAGFLTLAFYVKKHKLKFITIADLLAPYGALGQSIGRIGCFLNGCCYGRHWDHGIYFPVHQDKLYPTQLFDSIGLLIIFFILKRVQRTSRYPGQTIVLYLVLAASLRFVIEFFRADHFSTFWGLSIYQYICLGLIAFAGILHLRFKSKT